MPIPPVAGSRRMTRLAVTCGALVALLGTGLLAAGPASAQGIGGPGSQCVVAEQSEPFPAAYVIVLCSEFAPETDVEALQAFVASGNRNGVLAGPRESTGADDTDV